jgi:Xaa-Pro aminopeptidase
MQIASYIGARSDKLRSCKMVSKLLIEMGKMDIKAIFVFNIHNVRYLSQYKSDDAYLLITNKNKYFLTDPRYIEQAESECKDFIIVNWRKFGRLGDAIASLVDQDHIDRLYIEDSNISFNNYSQIQNAVSCEVFPLKGMIEEMRMVKSLQEIEYSKLACEIGDRAFNRILMEIKPGVSENELSAKLAYFLKSEGSDARCYENILISGPRTSLLHGIPSERKIQYGDLVLMDFGAGYQGYLSDMTRTVILGKASSEQREIYAIVKESVADMTASVKEGASGQEIYEASLKAMKGTKHIDYHYSGVGHGVGLAVHEKPFLGPTSSDVLRLNNIITLEPGLYIPGWGGIRIEDQVLVTTEGCEVLTKSDRHLIEID